jgi:hypothetical protein
MKVAILIFHVMAVFYYSYHVYEFIFVPHHVPVSLETDHDQEK